MVEAEGPKGVVVAGGAGGGACADVGAGVEARMDVEASEGPRA